MDLLLVALTGRDRARSRSGLRSLLIGNVAHEIVQQATRPVFHAPSSRVAGRRRDELIRGARSSNRRPADDRDVGAADLLELGRRVEAPPRGVRG